MIHIFYESPQELEIDSHFARIVQTVEEHDIQQLVIDGVTSYRTTLDDQRAYRDFFHALVAYSKVRLMTTFFNYEHPESFLYAGVPGKLDRGQYHSAFIGGDGECAASLYRCGEGARVQA
jgi:hypothetical protein